MLRVALQNTVSGEMLQAWTECRVLFVLDLAKRTAGGGEDVTAKTERKGGHPLWKSTVKASRDLLEGWEGGH